MRNYNNTNTDGQQDIKGLLIEELQNMNQDESLAEQTNASELHNKVFNEDYFIIGYHPAEEWLKANVGVFNAIGAIQKYENDMFGEVNTKLDNSESVVNMYAYILGEELIQDLDEDLTVAELLEELED